MLFRSGMFKFNNNGTYPNCCNNIGLHYDVFNYSEFMENYRNGCMFSSFNHFGDFNIDSTSILNGAGINNSNLPISSFLGEPIIPLTDITGKNRPNNPSIGPYEA